MASGDQDRAITIVGKPLLEDTATEIVRPPLLSFAHGFDQDGICDARLAGRACKPGRL
jgi:hypothetical protein